jgi:hypothetical protein
MCVARAGWGYYGPPSHSATLGTPNLWRRKTVPHIWRVLAQKCRDSATDSSTCHIHGGNQTDLRRTKNTAWQAAAATKQTLKFMSEYLRKGWD